MQQGSDAGGTDTGKAAFFARNNSAAITDNQYPFVLASIRSEGQFNSIIYEEKDSYRGTDTRWSILMNNDDMSALGISPGNLVKLSSAHGTMDEVKVFSFELPRGNVMAYYPEANVLIGRAHDIRSKTPAFKSVAVAVTPI